MSKEFYTSEIMKGAPEEFRSEVQRMIYERLDEARIDYSRIESAPGV